MHRAVSRRILPFLAGMTFLAQSASAQQSTSGLGNVLNNRGLPGEGGLNAIIATANLDLYIQEAGGGPVEGLAVVTLITLSGQVYRQGNATTGYIRFSDIAPTEYKLQVVAPAYERAVKQLDVPANASLRVTIVLQPSSASGDTALAAGYAKLTPKAQKEMAKSM